MKAVYEIYCKLCNTTITKNIAVCKCGNVACDFFKGKSHICAVFVDDLNTILVRKKYIPEFGNRRLGIKEKIITLKPFYRFNAGIVDSLSLEKDFNFNNIGVKPVVKFSGIKFYDKLNKWIKSGKKWAKDNEGWFGEVKEFFNKLNDYEKYEIRKFIKKQFKKLKGEEL